MNNVDFNTKMLLKQLISIMPIIETIDFNKRMFLFHSLPQGTGKPMVFSAGLLITKSWSSKKKSKIKRYIHRQIWRNNVSLLFFLLKQLISIMPIIETIDFNKKLLKSIVSMLPSCNRATAVIAICRKYAKLESDFENSLELARTSYGEVSPQNTW